MITKAIAASLGAALFFVWGMAVSYNDARALAHYDAHQCVMLGGVSQ